MTPVMLVICAVACILFNTELLPALGLELVDSTRPWFIGFAFFALSFHLSALLPFVGAAVLMNKSTFHNMLLLSVIVMSATGCATLNSGLSNSTIRSQSPEPIDESIPVTTASYQSPECGEFVNGEPQIERGRPNRLIDGIGWVFGIPNKILLWDSRADNHDVGDQTVSVVQRYLNDNNMQQVKVRVNQYDPLGEWRRRRRRRRRQNKAVHPGWRYTVGAFSTIGYTLLPGRLFGDDNYNPFTNTVSIYSDIPAVAVHEGAYAVDNARGTYHGTYGFAQGISGLNIWHETQASQLAWEWTQNTQSDQLIAEGKRILPPLCGVRVGRSLGGFFPTTDPLLPAAGAVTGHKHPPTNNRTYQFQLSV
jgi:hypothetical protein